ncbi:COX15/CtaA family protein, partial [Xanthobacter sp. V0B-10]|uniref:COX15/CtaA family protein n=1 Tax=Xanthobacter albus TaxID=3119929 RepID=UPI0037291223
SRTPAACGALILFMLVSLQATLGIATLLSAVALPVALAHQLGATVVLVAATVHASDLMRAPQRSR